MSRGSAVLAFAVALAFELAGASAADAACRVIEFQFTPAARTDDGVPAEFRDPRFFSPQIVLWLEDDQGHFIDTLFVTRMTGTFGIGNRPGRFDFNSELLWPYGRRQNIFPVWAERRGVTYPRVIFQDLDDDDLSHPLSDSSIDPHFCRPLMTTETTRQMTLDSGSCATTTYTDKGMFSDTETSAYPPRNDLAGAALADDPDVAMFAAMNDLDAISHATPTPGEDYTFLYAIPDALPNGAYVAWIEVSAEYDFNDTYNATSYPPPSGIAWSQYGTAYRGQPSVIWKVPFTLSTTDSAFIAADYAGYGDPSGMDGELNAPDPTITTNLEGSGANRLLLSTSPQGQYRFRVAVHPSDDTQPPGMPTQLSASSMVFDRASYDATFSFRAPGDDGDQPGTTTAYEIRYRLGAELTAANFETDGTLVEGPQPMPAGTLQSFQLPDLLPETRYWVGIRAKDDCLNNGPPALTSVVTPRAEIGDVDACFVATAAFGSPLAADVGLLRQFRDQALRSSVLGELFVETYYTFGPALAGVIAPSDALRSLARKALAPLVALARTTTAP